MKSVYKPQIHFIKKPIKNKTFGHNDGRISLFKPLIPRLNEFLKGNFNWDLKIMNL